MDLDQFAQTGNPFEFAILNPEWFACRPVANPYTVVAVPAAGNYANPFGPYTFFTIAVTPGAFYELIPGPNEVSFDLGILGGEIPLANGTPVFFQATNSQINLIGNAIGLPYTGTLQQIAGIISPFKTGGAGSTLAFSCPTETAKIRVLWRDQAGKRYQTDAALPTVTLTPDANDGYFEIEAVFKPVTLADVTLSTVYPGSGLTGLAGTLKANVTRSPSYQRLRLFGMPTVATTLRVLGKAQYVPIDYGTQEPGLRNSENVLIAFTRGDMLRRGGENGAASMAFTEATALLQVLKDVEAVQAAHNARIIPDDGYGPQWGFGPCF
jgi:hypothetical protein